MITRQALFASLAVAVGAGPAAGQRCTPPDTAAGWFTRQREWLSDAKHDWSDNAFRGALVAAAGIDTSRALPAQFGVQLEGARRSTAADTAMLTRLRSLGATRGSAWPLRQVVGAAGVRAVWWISQSDTALQRTTLHRMMESGGDQALAADVAVLEDRVRLQSGRKQIYGSQLHMVGGRLVPEPIEDSAHVDMRRDAAGLPPLRDALCVAR